MPMLIATDDEKRSFFQLLKSQGFDQGMRREVWLLCSGARMALYNRITQGTQADNELGGQDYLSLVTLYNKKYPTQNKHQIAVDMPRTFQDDQFFRCVGGKKKHPDQKATGKDVKLAIKRICTAYSVRNC